MTRPLRVATDRSASTVLAREDRRRATAESWLEQVLDSWQLPPGLGGRWLAPADTHLRVPGDITLNAAYDPDVQIFSLEIWYDRRRIYGLDDWLG